MKLLKFTVSKLVFFRGTTGTLFVTRFFIWHSVQNELVLKKKMSGRDVNQHIKVFVADKLSGSVFQSSTGNAREQCRLRSVWCTEAVYGSSASWHVTICLLSFIWLVMRVYPVPCDKTQLKSPLYSWWDDELWVKIGLLVRMWLV